MIVDHISSYGAGGAGIAARRIHESIPANQVNSRFWCLRGLPANAPTSCRLLPRAKSRSRFGSLAAAFRKATFKFRLWQSLRGRPAELEPFNPPWNFELTPCPAELQDGNLVHLHWIARHFDLASFLASIPLDRPLVWTLHDMHPMTGGCHYAGKCPAFEKGCSNCVQLGRSGSKDLAWQGYERKRAALQDRNLHLVADSHWLEDRARASALFTGAASFRTIHYGLNLEDYRPHNKRAARFALGLPPDRKIIAFGAESLQNRRKGLALLLRAFSLLPDRSNLLGIVFGHGQVDGHVAGIEIRSMGFLTDPRRQALVYSAADLFAMPSLEEAFGQTGLESLGCGTPVVAFAAGGIPDYVRDGVTGHLAKVGDVADLARQLQRLLEDREARERMGCTGRSTVELEFRAQTQGQLYADLYREILDAPARVASTPATSGCSGRFE